MACEGAKPVVAIYSTFLQRAYDQAIHDVALQNLDVTFAIDRAGVVGPDGATHSGSFDLSFLRCLPNMLIMAPADENECRMMLSTGIPVPRARRHALSARHRYWRGRPPTLDTLPIGKAELRRRGHGAGTAEFRRDAVAGRRNRRRTGRHAGQHAFHQTAGRNPAAGAGEDPRRVRHRWKTTPSPAAPVPPWPNAWLRMA